MTMGQGDQHGRYWKGKHTKEERERPWVYVVETITDNEFTFVGTVTITMGEVWDAMDATRNIKDNFPSKFAKKHAREKYPEANPVITMPIEEWEEKYGKLSNYKKGDIVK